MFRPLSAPSTTITPSVGFEENEIQSRPVTPNNEIYEIDGLLHSKRFSTAEQEFLEKLKGETIFSKNFLIKEKEYFKNKSILGSSICSKNSKIYIFGGKFDQNHTNSFYTYSLIDNEWNEVNNLNLPKMSNHTMSLVGDSFLIFGGENEIHQFNDLYSFDFKEWKKIEPLSQIKPSKRSKHTSISYNDSLLVFGGFSRFNLINSNVYQYKNGVWSILKCSGQIPTPRYSHASILYGDKMIIFGGIVNGRITNEYFELDLKNFEWRVKIFFD
jgi:N-acetylneuraminic acid mutarotase